MKTTKTQFLLATSAIVGVAAFSATPAFAQVSDTTGGAAVITDAATLDANQNVNLFLVDDASATPDPKTETLTIGSSTPQTIGDGTGAAITAEDAQATELTITNTGATAATTLNVAGDIVQGGAAPDLSLAVTNAEAQNLNIAVDGDLDLAAGTVAVTSSANATDLAVTGNKAGAGAITLDGQAGGVASLTLNGTAAQTVNGAIDAVAASANTGITVNNATGVTFGGVVGGGQAVESLTVTSGNATFSSAATFSGDVTGAGTMTNAAAVNVGGDISVADVDLDASGDLTLNGTEDQAVSSSIDGVVDTNGSITVNNTGPDTTTTFSGVIGGENTVGSLTVTDGKTVLAADAEFSGVVTVAASKELTNNADLTVGGDLAGTGTFTNSASAIATLTGDVSGASTVNNAGTLSINGGDNAGTINNAGRLNVGAPITNTGTVDLASSGSTVVDLGALTDGQAAFSGATGAVNLTGDAKVLLNPALVDTNTVIIADADNATTNGDLATHIDQLSVANALRQVTVADNAGAIEATIGEKNNAAQTAAALGISELQGSKLNQAGFANVDGDFTGAFAPVGTAVGNALTGSSAEAKAEAERLGDATAAAGAASDAGINAFAASGRSVGTRLASLRGEETSVAAGNQVASDNVWFEGHANFAEQDARKGAEGFETDSYGGTVGYDRAAGANSRVGLAFTYDKADIEGDSAANVDQDVDTYLVNLYSEKSMGRNFVNGSVHFGVQDADISQTVSGLGRMSGSYANQQYGANVEFGRNIAMGGGRIVPTAGLNWTHINGESYDLVDGSGNAVEESFSSRDQVQGKAGLRYEHDYQTANGGMLRPAVYGNFGYDFASDEITTTRNFGGTLINDEQAEIAEESVGFGAAFTYESPDRTTAVQIGYDGEYRDEYLSHAGKVRFSYRF